MRLSDAPSDTIEREEELAQRDMVERGRRLSAFKRATEGRVWWHGRNGEAFLVSAHIASSNAPVSAVARSKNPDRLLARRVRRALQLAGVA